jgi:hypothetical protein
MHSGFTMSMCHSQQAQWLWLFCLRLPGSLTACVGGSTPSAGEASGRWP